MQAVLRVIADLRAEIEEHPLHRWLIAQDDGIAAENKLWFSLYFANFIMYFRELNLYHVGYAEENVTNEPRKLALTAHGMEDATHSRLFMRDFKTLEWDKLLPWKPSEVFYWLFSSEVNRQLRRRTVTLAKLYIEAEDPAVRYAVVEAVEACGNALFRHTNVLAERYKRGKNKDLVYWGAHHLARETGHAVAHNEEHLFSTLELTPAQRAEAISKARRAFALIDEQNSHMLELAQDTISHGGFHHHRLSPERTLVLPAASPAHWRGFRVSPDAYGVRFWPQNPHKTQRPLVERIVRFAGELRTHEMLAFLRPTDLKTAIARLRKLLLFYATDAAGTPTFYRHMVAFAHPKSAEERALNRIACSFGTRSELLYQDWRALQLDECLAWPTSRTLEFIYLDPATETHRDLRAIITHHIDVTQDPFLRYWTVVALKAMSGAYSEECARLACFVEDKLGIKLPYLSQRQVPRVGLPNDAEADAVHFEERELSSETVNAAQSAIERIARGARVRSQCLLTSAQNREYPELLTERVDLRALASVGLAKVAFDRNENADCGLHGPRGTFAGTLKVL